MPLSTTLRRPTSLIILAVATVIGFAPVLSVLTASGVAGLLGCRLDEGGVHACLLLGQDIGDLLYTLFVLGWLMFLTWPLMIGTLTFWVVLAIIALLERRKRPGSADRSGGTSPLVR